MGIFQDQLDFVRSPRSFVTRMATEPRAARLGFRNVLAVALLYELAILLWSFGAEALTLPPLLRIPEHQYYSWELVFLIPLFIITWLLASAIGYTASRLMGGRGSFDGVLAGFGLTMTIGTYFTLIPDLIQGVLWTTGWVSFGDYQELTARPPLAIIVWAYLAAYVCAHLVWYSVTLRHTLGLSRGKAALAGVLALVGSFAIWITFVR